ncbi:MAG: hypothetical protein GY821_07270 [Gammaproteobacteria bacterium]|nr:hypothetical protein [Gammaproteobacteria bacterium]
MLSEYIIYGYQFLKTRCAEPADVVIHSINVMAVELFALLEERPEYVAQLAPHQLPEIKKIINDCEVYEETKIAFNRIEHILPSS